MAQLDKTPAAPKNPPARIAAGNNPSPKINSGSITTGKDNGKIETVNMQTNNQRAVRILAKSLYRQLKDSGYHNRDVLALSAELVGLITTDLRPGADASVEAPLSTAAEKRISG